jgi:hypothetical protein
MKFVIGLSSGEPMCPAIRKSPETTSKPVRTDERRERGEVVVTRKESRGAFCGVFVYLLFIATIFNGGDVSKLFDEDDPPASNPMGQ